MNDGASRWSYRRSAALPRRWVVFLNFLIHIAALLPADQKIIHYSITNLETYMDKLHEHSFFFIPLQKAIFANVRQST